MKVLQVCYKMPFSDKDGGSYSLRSCALSLLSQPEVELKILAMNASKDWVDPIRVENDVLMKRADFEWVAVDTRLKPLKMITNLFKKDSYLSVRFFSLEFREKLIEVLTHETFDIVQLEHLYLCHYIKDIRQNSNAKIVLRAQNVECDLWRTIANHTGHFFRRAYLNLAINRLQKMEVKALDQIDGLICLTADDLAVFRKHSKSLPASVIPVGFNFKSQKNELVSTAKPVVYHLGSMDWLPNIQGVNWFLNKVLPILARLEPKLSIHLAGKKMPQAYQFLKNPNLIVDGEVDDAQQYQADKSILIVPVISGSGIRVKIIEAMALGKVVISTSLGAQGIEAIHNQNILIANEPENFAQCIIDCWKSANKREKLGQNAALFAGRHFDLDQLGRDKFIFYKSLLQNG